MYRQIEALIDPLTPKIQTFDLRILDSLEKGIQKNSQGHPPAIKSLQTTKKKQQPYPIRATRANPFPKVTGLFCRIPLPTLFTLSRVSETWGPDAVIGAPCHGLSADWWKRKNKKIRPIPQLLGGQGFKGRRVRFGCCRNRNTLHSRLCFST